MPDPTRHEYNPFADLYGPFRVGVDPATPNKDLTGFFTCSKDSRDYQLDRIEEKLDELNNRLTNIFGNHVLVEGRWIDIFSGVLKKIMEKKR